MKKVITRRECPMCGDKMDMIMNDLYECNKCGTILSTNGRKTKAEENIHEDKI